MPEPLDDRRPQTFAAFLGCCAIWGSTFLVIRIGNDALPPLWAASLRLMLAAPILIAITKLTGHSLPRGAALRAAAWFGFLNFGLGFCLLYWGETRVPSGLTAVMYGTIPLAAPLFARMFGIEKLSPLKVAGAVVALGGVVLVFSGQIGGRLELGPLCAVLGAALLAALSGVLLRRGPAQSAFGANAVAATVGLAVCLAGTFLAREPHALPATRAAWGPVLYLTAAGSIVAFVLYAWLVHRWPVSRSSLIAVVVPIVAVGLGALVRHERLSPAELGGTALVLLGISLAVASDGRRGARPH